MFAEVLPNDRPVHPGESVISEILNQAERRLECQSPDAPELKREIHQLNSELGRYRNLLPPEEWAGVVREVGQHPLAMRLRREPITGRSAARPRGYAGDAELLDMIYFGHQVPEATSVFDGVVHSYVFESSSCRGVRERRKILAGLIDDVASSVMKPTVLSIAAGHLREADLSNALRQGAVGRWIALDQDRESLNFISGCYPASIELVAKPVAALLNGSFDPGPLDLAYAAGLYDYLPMSVAKKLTRTVARKLKPGGRFLFANFASDVFDVGYMEAIMDWHLILRTPSDMDQIAKAAGDGFNHRSWTGVAGAIHYHEIQRQM